MSSMPGKCPQFGRLVPPCQLQRNQPVIFRWVIGLVLVHCAGALPLMAFGNAGDDTTAELHWAFRPLVHPDVPELDKPDRIRSPIDAFVAARLAAEGLCLSTDANRERLIRRAYFDLLGLPPGPAHVEAFLSDTRLDSYEQLVDRLLDSPQFGVRWGRHWLDIVGYTDSISFDDDYGPPIGFTEGKWRYRDYVVQSFNEDKPYDRFVMEQLAGDEIDNWRDATRFTPEILQHLIATGYLRCCEDISGEDKRPFIIWSVLHDTVAQLGTSLLGLSLNCARCHDHKFEPISQSDYYSLVALLAPALNATDYPANPHERQPLWRGSEQCKPDRLYANRESVSVGRQRYGYRSYEPQHEQLESFGDRPHRRDPDGREPSSGNTTVGHAQPAGDQWRSGQRCRYPGCDGQCPGGYRGESFGLI